MQGGVTGVDPGDLAIALWSMIERFNYYRHTRATGLTDDAAVDNLAVVAQLIVFPETPSAVLTARDHSRTLGRNWAQAAAVFEAMPGWKPREGRFASLSDEAFTTVSASSTRARVFASNGYHDTSANMIVREAGRSRGTLQVLRREARPPRGAGARVRGEDPGAQRPAEGESALGRAASLARGFPRAA